MTTTTLPSDAVLDEDVAGHVAAFERDGYAQLRGIYSDEQVVAFHRLRDEAVRDWCFVNGTSDTPDAVDNLVERFPRVGLTAVSHPLVLAFAEAVMGPVVQLDSAVLASDPSVDPDRRGEPVAWHRDRFGFFPLGVYTRPHSIVFLAYLQEMTDEVGPLRVVPGSHIDPVAVDFEDKTKRHADEVLIHALPGDVVAVHHNLLHSGTRNVSGRERRFLGFIYNMSSLIHRDTFDGPNCQALLATARRTNDRRLLRLLGQDPLVVPRQNSGFIQPHTSYWPTWHNEDRAHAADAAAAQAAVRHAREAVT